MHSPMFTLEVFPPKRNAPVGTIYDTLDGLEGLNPDFISVTYGHGTHSDRTATARIAIRSARNTAYQQSPTSPLCTPTRPRSTKRLTCSKKPA